MLSDFARRVSGQLRSAPCAFVRRRTSEPLDDDSWRRGVLRFANEIFEQAKVECRALSITSEEFGAAAPRPAFSALTSQREHAIRLPTWEDGLAGYLAQRQAEESS